MSSKQCKHAHTHTNSLCVQFRISQVLRDVGFIVIPLMRQEAYNLALSGCTPPATPTSCLLVVEDSLHYILRLIFYILNLPSYFVLNVLM